ncbi:hypothetical protein AM500_23110 [Bacillus sp. FJAT-18017]|uniref:GreA/GreB family elongation factor n=1 Tax=Bacillus sp. FJAT-18017 TaxID=1705566 RepID=UPI0006AE0A00|nr:GreA/GreB family elongation factor [Bacillus sp. FJAT-18017]ALC92336.1 hypothetical protein AM500_23110 [Bacillus sp. FJAT-18017]
MNHSQLLSKEYFIQQLVYIDENIKELTHHYLSSTPVDERKKDFYNTYSLEVENLIKENQRNDSISSFQKVFIGTKVTVMYDDDNETEDYIICYPDESDPDSGSISFLSPVGRQLLLKSVGEKVALKVPTGVLSVTIKEIEFAGQALELESTLKEA